MKESNIIMTIRIVQELEEQREEHYTQLPAVMKLKGNERWIVFKEQIGKEVIPTVYRIAEKSVKIIRNGSLKMNHTYEGKKKTKSDYVSPFGSMVMETDTNTLEISDQSIRIHYDLYMGGDWVSTNAIAAEWTYVS
ncbi:MAG: DUF1934 domain-containing protein [Bacilli bacterium]